MVALPPFLPLAGLCTSPGSGTPKHCAEALNVFAHNGRIVKRKGGVSDGFVQVHSRGGVDFTFAAAAEPTVYPNVVFPGQGSLGRRVFFTSGRPTVDTIMFYGKNAAPTHQREVLQPKDVKLWYWNGSAYALVPNYAWVHKPSSSVKTSTWGVVEITQAEFPSGSTGHNNEADNSYAQDFFTWVLVFEPPKDWATHDIPITPFGATYWMYIEVPAGGLWDSDIGGGGNTLAVASLDSPAGTSTGMNAIEAADIGSLAEEHARIGRLMTWRDRRGKRHELFIAMSVDAATSVTNDEILVLLDRVELTLAPGSDATLRNTNDTHPDAYRQLGVHCPATDAAYLVHPVLGWIVVRTNSNPTYSIFTPTPDNELQDTPYHNITGGMRAGLDPKPTSVVLHDGRIFYATGQRLVWSSPGEWVDIWPLNNEMDIADDNGNITGLASYGGVLYAFKERATYAVSPLGSDADGYQSQVVLTGNGCVGPSAVCVTSNHVVFLSPDGLYAFDGSSVQKLTGNIGSFFSPGQTESSDWSKSTVLFHPAFNQVRVYYRSILSTLYLDKALFVNIAPLIGGSADADPEAGVSCWPQGPYDLPEPVDDAPQKMTVGDWGFRATCVTMDQAREPPQVMCAHPGAWLSIQDQGTRDGPSPVKAKWRSLPAGVGGAAMTMLRWVSTTVAMVANTVWKTWVVFDEHDRRKVEYQVSAIKAPGAELFSDSTVFDDSTTFSDISRLSTREVPFSRRARGVSLGAKHEVEGPAEWVAIQAELNPLGRRGER